MYDIGIEQGEVYADGGFFPLNVYINEGKIAAVTKDTCPCKKRIDASKKHVMPGFIDPHVHFALGVGDKVSKDDFYTGSIEAVYGGVTTYIDFLDPIKEAKEIPFEFEKRNAMAKKSVVDYAFHATVANPVSSAKEIIENCKAFGIDSVKLFTTYSDTDRRTYDKQIYELLKESKEQDAVIVVHAENDELVYTGADIKIADHENARPVLTENMEVVKLGQMAKASGGNLYIVHVSAGSSAMLMAKNFKEEMKEKKIVLESCPHYFLLNSDCLKLEDGYKYTMTPPIRKESERVMLNEYIDAISTIGTDHCPYTKAQKAHSYTSEVPMGIGGIRYSFLNMYNQFGFSIVDKFTTGPADAYHLNTKGRILPGMDGDIVIFDTMKDTVVDDEMSVYDKKRLHGRIETVLVRGKVVLEEEELQEHTGTYIRRGE